MDTSTDKKKAEKVVASVGQRGGFYFLRKPSDTSTTEIGNCQVVRVHEDGTVDLKLPNGGNRYGLTDVQEAVDVGTVDDDGDTRTDRFFVPRQRIGAPSPTAPGGHAIGPSESQRITDLEARCAAGETRIGQLEASIARLAEKIR